MDPGHHVDDRAVRSGCAGVERGMVQSYVIQISRRSSVPIYLESESAKSGLAFVHSDLRFEI